VADPIGAGAGVGVARRSVAGSVESPNTTLRSGEGAAATSGGAGTAGGGSVGGTGKVIGVGTCARRPFRTIDSSIHDLLSITSCHTSMVRTAYSGTPR
jgi:hypothetical protein